MAEPVIMTAAGKAKLEAELDELVNVRRPAVLLRIREAKALGDLRENFDFQDAKREQAFLEGRIQALKETLGRARVVSEEEMNSEGVGIGSTVEMVHLETGSVCTYTIVGAVEADPAKGKISNASPVGKALMGQTEGATVTITTPRGVQQYRIQAIRRNHETTAVG
ncbi:MAG TPA: transcription elongation factor GreA [Armatimonadetes bacterium]|jgi:transcription elongation factor GreA|nr:transcription elongation factor GreA [Armatimonadota bacterium]HOJ21957.1 transcription elongation factor GreA [Armatimonadota bacterium]HOM81267.1 transcription elongation factor GreA [Armatimonadota bacterium]HPO72865.1 transcription elongation factor GreA [Armatimonadota bacterium]